MGCLPLQTLTVHFNGLTSRLRTRYVHIVLRWWYLLTFFQTDYLTKILFTKAHCLCHDVNNVTKSISHLDVIMGFSTGEIIWWEPTSQRYTRLNKNVSGLGLL